MTTREFTDYEASAANKPMPLIVGITSPSGGGKTFSALRLAAGMVRVVGGAVFGVDTESDRMLHYKKLFKFQHVPFPAPHSPADYEAAVDYCLRRGAKVIIIDSMTHEHDGEGGVLEMIEAFLERRAGDDDIKRDKLKFTAQIEPKAMRRRLNRKIVHAELSDHSKPIFILCYRAEDKTKPQTGGKPVHLGWQAVTTSTLPYEMTVRFLLPPGSDGHPNLTPDTEFEKLAIKNPLQFREWFRPGFQLTEEIGEKLARWSLGETSERESLLDQIQAALVAAHPGSGAEAKDAKIAALRDHFGVATWKEAQGLDVELLRAGLKAFASAYASPTPDSPESQGEGGDSASGPEGIPPSLEPSGVPAESSGPVIHSQEGDAGETTNPQPICGDSPEVSPEPPGPVQVAEDLREPALLPAVKVEGLYKLADRYKVPRSSLESYAAEKFGSGSLESLPATFEGDLMKWIAAEGGRLKKEARR